MTDPALPRPTPGAHAEAVPEGGSPRVDGVEGAARSLAAVTAAGFLLGVLIGGVGGRLAMSLLASLNPAADGVISDDGFEMGRFTVGGTAQLLLASVQFGLVGALLYFALRNLAIGPRWVRVSSLTAGGTVVFGALVIHDGVDFTLLEPASLAMALFVAIPLVFIPTAAMLVEHWLRPDSWFMTADRYRVGVVLAGWLLTGPVLLVVAPLVAAGFGVRRALRGVPMPARVVAAWVARGVLGGVGILALVDLVADINTFA